VRGDHNEKAITMLEVIYKENGEVKIDYFTTKRSYLIWSLARPHVEIIQLEETEKLH
jgi:hypothetical protein